MLGLVHQGVGALRDGFRGVVFPDACDADGSGHREMEAFKFDIHTADGVQTFFCDRPGVGRILNRIDPQEFFAAPASEDVILPVGAGDGVRQFLQYKIAGLVAVRIVEFTEVVHIHEEDAKLLVHLLSQDDAIGKGIVKKTAVGNAGQLIMMGNVAELADHLIIDVLRTDFTELFHHKFQLMVLIKDRDESCFDQDTPAVLVAQEHFLGTFLTILIGFEIGS